jgi:hypothetical protein
MPRRADGVALCSQNLSEGRQVVSSEGLPYEHSSFDIELREDGGVRVFVGRLTDSRSEFLVMDGLAVAYTTRLVEWARLVAESTGYRGRWLIGVAASGLRGRRSYAAEQLFREEGPTYNVDDYREVGTTDYFELDQQPGEVASRLVGRLLRGLGTAECFEPHIQYPTTVRASI